MNNEAPETIVQTDLHFLKDIGLQEHLSPTRANGLASMVKKMKVLALQYLQSAKN
jgi:cysteine desulfuration protein SufE